MNIQNIIREIKRANKDEKKRIKDKAARAVEEVGRLKKDFLNIDKDMEKMILFGSLAEGNIKSIYFDIDIAVKSKKYYLLVGRALQSDFKVDVVDLDSIHEKIKKTIVEKGRVIYAKRAGSFSETSIGTGEGQWHKDLLDRMTIEIKDIRPRLFDRNLAYKINELRAFRHIFRYIYQSKLDIEKLKNLNKKVPEIIKEFKHCHNLFIENLQKIIKALGIFGGEKMGWQ